MKLRDTQHRALEAVADGRVKHIHPFTWVISLQDLDAFKPRTLQGLAKNHLIRVEANSTEYHRPVHVTDAGKALIRNGG